jgi:hypothetical protein
LCLELLFISAVRDRLIGLFLNFLLPVVIWLLCIRDQPTGSPAAWSYVT